MSHKEDKRNRVISISSLLSFHGDISQQTDIGRRGWKTEEKTQAGKTQTAKINSHSPAISSTMTNVPRTG